MSALLNIGCGATFHAEWINLDAAPSSPEVQAHDIATGLPFAEGRFEAVYASHVLEHFEPDAGLRLLRECRRVLRPGGIVRIVVPDLEAIVRAYLEALEAAARGDRDAEARYDWMMLELYDQTVRTKSGGRMAEYLAGPLQEGERRFIGGRVGDEALRAAVPPPEPPRGVRAACASLILGPKMAQALRVGRFREGGELHQWMYDRFSLRRALERAGFTETMPRAADESGIARFATFGLETVGGRPRKPDSLYMEGRKPG